MYVQLYFFKKQEKIMSPEYIAGFFDADGSVGVYKRGNGYQLNVTIANSGFHGKQICKLLQNQFAGCLTFTNSNKKTQREVFWWKLNGCHNCKAFLLYIRDFVIIKKDQVEKSLEFIEEWQKMPRYNKTQEQLNYLHNTELILKDMKKKC